MTNTIQGSQEMIVTIKTANKLGFIGHEETFNIYDAKKIEAIKTILKSDKVLTVAEEIQRYLSTTGFTMMAGK